MSRPHKRGIGDHVPTRRSALALAKQYGCTVEPGPASGEVRVIAPDGTRINLNNRRKDAPMSLLLLLRRLGPKD